MSVELPTLSAVVARLADPQINLAAYGGIVFPIALIIESPIIMLLSASTALSKDWTAYRKLYQFMMTAGAALTFFHVMIAFTPLYYVVSRQMMGVPEEIVEPGRLGLMLITPWTWSIAYRRFQQGVLIRFGQSRAVGVGTVIRLISGGLVLLIGYLLGTIPGVAVGALAQSAGVLSEAVYAGIRVQQVIRRELPTQEAAFIGWKRFADFYIPLAMTSMLSLLWQPLGSAALSRMPDPMISLSVWPVVSGFVNMFRSVGYAVNETVLASLTKEGSYKSLIKFIRILAVTVTGLQCLALVTPAAKFWFGSISALPAQLQQSAWFAFLFAVPMAGITVFQSWYQGAIVSGGKTGAIPEATAIFLGVFLSIAIFGIFSAVATGLYVGMAGFVVANLAQAIWLGIRSRKARQFFQIRDAN